MNKIPRIYKSKLKFTESEKTGEMISFVHSSKGSPLRGVHENDDLPKQIVLISKDISDSIEIKEKVLYDVQLIPMKKGKGYLVVDISVTEFEAIIETQPDQITISFGNKVIFFKPRELNPSMGTIEGVSNLLNSRIDIKNKDLVISIFEEKAKELVDILSLREQEDVDAGIVALQEKYGRTA